MADLMTTRQLQEVLHIDRTTIYRMIAHGSLAAIRVGKQWRFDRSSLLAILESGCPDETALLPDHMLPDSTSRRQDESGQTTDPPAALQAARSQDRRASRGPDDLLPAGEIQIIQDLFAELLGVMILTTDMDGKPLSRVSNPCGYFSAVADLPGVIARCTQTWRRLASVPGLEPRLELSDLGLLCARGLIRCGPQLIGIVVAGGIAPDDWPPTEAQVAAIAADFEVSADRLAPYVSEVYRLDAAGRSRLLHSVQAIADVFSYLLQDREQLRARLEAIGSLAQF